MTAIWLALFCALSYGTSDFIGGVISQRIKPWTVALWAQSMGAVVVAVAAIFVGGSPTVGDLGWSILSGVGNGLGVAFLYKGLSSGRMGVVAPISGIGAAVVPVLVGLLAGERPAALVWTGIVIAIPAIWMVTRQPGGAAASTVGVTDGVLAGLGFGVSFAAIGQIPESAGLWPVSLNLAIAGTAVAIGAVIARQPLVPHSRAAFFIVVPGVLAGSAMIGFLLASQHGHLTVVGVIAALYPAVTVVLAMAVLRERIHAGQAVGLLMCASSVALVASG